MRMETLLVCTLMYSKVHVSYIIELRRVIDRLIDFHHIQFAQDK